MVGIYQHWESGLTLSERNSKFGECGIYTADEDEKNVGLHSKCHTLFTPKEGPLDEYLKAMLDHFFITHDSIKENLQQLSNAASESDKQERVKVKGFAAYKDNSTPLPVDDKQ